MTTEPQWPDDLSRHPGINADLVKEYFDKGDLANLTTLFDFMRRAMLRAESLSRAYQSQMFELHRRLDDARSPDRIIAVSKPRREVPDTVVEPKPKLAKPARPSKPDLSVDIEL